MGENIDFERLGTVEDPRVVDPLIYALTTSSYDIRYAAAKSLAKIPQALKTNWLRVAELARESHEDSHGDRHADGRLSGSSSDCSTNSYQDHHGDAGISFDFPERPDFGAGVKPDF
ncbi:MAG: HEAT repeat domain-containing protein [Chromatiales bacterium]|nr:HEAT repeat domain-containing protein [Gammaproteobacteria bacterium]